jgi:hypothetical protein
MLTRFMRVVRMAKFRRRCSRYIKTFVVDLDSMKILKSNRV